MQEIAYMVDGPDELRAELFGSLFVLLQNLSRRADEQLERFELTSRQWLLLAVIDKAFPGAAPTIGEAAAAYGSSRQNITQIARQLADRGYLTLEPDSRDRRAVRLTPTARRAIFDDPAVQAEQTRILADMFGALTPSELVAMHDLVLRCLARNAGARTAPDPARGGPGRETRSPRGGQP
jgi:DNA-binding MarR family transcriptional regulator